MRVLIQGYNTLMQAKSGGAQVRFTRIIKELKQINVDIKAFEPIKDKVDDCDILHIFHLNTENLSLVKCAKSAGKKVVVSSIVNTCGQKTLTLSYLLRYLPISTTYGIQHEVLSLADTIIAETEQEKKFIGKYYHIDTGKIIVIPNGADRYEKTNEIFDRTGIPVGEKYVLQVGRFDENKNQINVIKALKNTGIHLVFMGAGGSQSDSYYSKCLEEAKGYDNIHFLGWVENGCSLFKSAYSNATVFVCPSFVETFGLTIIEGGLSGATVALSNTLPILEYKELSDAITFNPKSVSDIKKNILFAYDNPMDISDKLSERFSWESVAEEHKKCYLKLLRKID